MLRSVVLVPALLVGLQITTMALAGDPRAPRNGDVNADGVIDMSDTVYLLRFLFGDGPGPVSVAAAAPAREATIVYLVRHAEDDKSQPDRPLSPEGEARARLLADRLRDAAFTRVLSSHKQRTFQTVLPTAQDQGIVVEQVPEPGSVLEDGEVVSEETSTAASIEPTVAAILASPPGSRLLVAGHSSTLFAIMADLGVPVDSPDDPCDPGDTSCLPCVVKACFPGGFENMWTVSIPATPAADAAMAHLHYGDVCPTMP